MENILTFLGDEMNGDSWENLGIQCLSPAKKGQLEK